MNCDVYESYAEVNEALELSGERALTNDRNPEDPAVIVGVRKWTWDGMGDEGPDWPLNCFGLQLLEHVPVHDKYDLFIYGAA